MQGDCFETWLGNCLQIFKGFPQSLQANPGITLALGQVCFLAKPFCIVSRVTLEAIYSLSLIFILTNS
jgi:hypothetical protein